MALSEGAQDRDSVSLWARRFAVGLLVAGLAACSTTVSPSSSPTAFPPVRIYNQTSVAVSLVVNGSTIAVIPAEGKVDPVSAAFPARPWAIELRSPSGRVLLTSTVPAGAVTVGIYPTGPALACGAIYVAVAGPLPISEPAFTLVPGAIACD